MGQRQEREYRRQSKISVPEAMNILPTSGHYNLHLTSTLPAKAAFILPLYSFLFEVVSCLFGWLVNLPISCDARLSPASPSQPPWQVLSSTDSLTHKPLVNFLTLPHTHFPFLGQRVCFKMQIWSCQSSYLKLFNSTFFPVWVFQGFFGYFLFLVFFFSRLYFYFSLYHDISLGCDILT